MDNSNLNLGEAASRFLASLPPKEAGVSPRAIHQFVRWFGQKSPLARLEASEIANYTQRLSSEADYLQKLELIRGFLNYAKSEGWTNTNLATHIKAKKEKPRLAASTRRGLAQPISLTQQGYDEIREELVSLKGRRLQAIEEIRRAAADKDFRENAPLDAAREQLAQLEGRIRELEQTLKSATLVEAKVNSRAGIGNSVILHELASGEKLSYTIVSPKEVDPTRGRISSASPLGRAIIGRGPGDIIEIIAPAGRLRYRIEQVGAKDNLRDIDTDSISL